MSEKIKITETETIDNPEGDLEDLRAEMASTGRDWVPNYMRETWGNACNKYNVEDMMHISSVLESIADGNYNNSLKTLKEECADNAFVLTAVALFHPEGVGLVISTLIDVYGKPTKENLAYLEKIEKFHDSKIKAESQNKHKVKSMLGKILVNNQEDDGDHGGRLVDAINSSIDVHELSDDTIQRSEGILSNKTLPQFAKQMTLFQLIHPIEQLHLEYDEFDSDNKTKNPYLHSVAAF